MDKIRSLSEEIVKLNTSNADIVERKIRLLFGELAKIKQAGLALDVGIRQACRDDSNTKEKT